MEKTRSLQRRDLSLPEGWRVARVASSPACPPLAEDELPGKRSIPVPAGRAVIVVNDARRPTPTAWLLERLEVDWERDDITVAVATGSHPPPGGEELREIFGPFLERVRPRLVLHRSLDEDLVSVGRTSRGTPVEVNPCLAEAASVICLGSVEPHYFAGWTGGRKSLVPGLCSLETMRLNHRLAMEETGPGRIEGNSLHLDLMEGAALVAQHLQANGGGRLLALNVIVKEDALYGFSSGPLAGAVEDLAGRAGEVFGRKLEGVFPVVLCRVDHPLGRDLYQALKAFENWKRAVAPGGALIVHAPCEAGMGPPTFRQFLEEPPALDDLLSAGEEAYRLGDHKLANFLRYRESGRELIAASAGLRDGSDFPLPVFSTSAGALKYLEGRIEPSGREVLVVEDAAHTFPLFGD